MHNHNISKFRLKIYWKKIMVLTVSESVEQIKKFM